MERLDFDSAEQVSSVELAIHLTRYLPVSQLVKNRNVLDIACGQGYASYAMRKFWGARSVTGIDVDRDAILAARKRFGEPGIRFNRRDAAEWLALGNGRFGVITCVETIEHVSDPAAVLRGLDRVAHPQSAILVTCPNDQWYYGNGPSLNPHHRSVWSFDEFKSLSEGILGAATSWYAGARVDGFGNYRMAAPAAAGDALTRSLQHSTRSIVVPASDGSGPSQTDCLYFSGLWLRGIKPPAEEFSSAFMFNSPSQRPPPIGRLGEKQCDGQRRIAILTQTANPDQYHLAQLAEQLSQRLPADVLQVNTDDDPTIFKRLTAGDYCFILLAGPAALEAYVRTVKSSKTAMFDALASTAVAVVMTPDERFELGNRRKILNLFDRVHVTDDIRNFVTDGEALVELAMSASERAGLLGPARVAALSL